VIPVIRDGHVVDHIAHELTDREATRISRTLARDGIRVEPVADPFGVLHLWALAPTSTLQEVTALAAFAAETDCRLAWHGAVAS
jgi:hypothetical protein